MQACLVKDSESCSNEPNIFVKVMSAVVSTSSSGVLGSSFMSDFNGEGGVDLDARMLEPRTPTVESAVTLRTGDPSGVNVKVELESLLFIPNDGFVGESFLV